MTRYEILNLKPGDYVRQTLDLDRLNDGRFKAKDDARWGRPVRVTEIVMLGTDVNQEIFVQFRAEDLRSDVPGSTITSSVTEGDETWCVVANGNLAYIISEMLDRSVRVGDRYAYVVDGNLFDGLRAALGWHVNEDPGVFGRCDTCGAPNDVEGCTSNRSHTATVI